MESIEIQYDHKYNIVATNLIRKIIKLVSGNSRERQAFRFFLFRGLSHRILFDHDSHCVLAVSLDRICSYKHVYKACTSIPKLLELHFVQRTWG
jgi:hypothetical protein